MRNAQLGVSVCLPITVTLEALFTHEAVSSAIKLWHRTDERTINSNY